MVECTASEIMEFLNEEDAFKTEKAQIGMCFPSTTHDATHHRLHDDLYLINIYGHRARVRFKRA